MSNIYLVHNQHHTTPKIFRSDGGGEYTSHAFKTYLQYLGIIHQLSCPHTPEQNRLSECKHRNLLDLTSTLLHDSNLPAQFWAEALATSNHFINCLPSKSISLISVSTSLWLSVDIHSPTHFRMYPLPLVKAIFS